jgi:hypothetical protein
MTRLLPLLLLASCAAKWPSPQSYHEGDGAVLCGGLHEAGGDRARIYRAVSRTLTVAGVLCGASGIVGATAVGDEAGQIGLVVTSGVCVGVAAAGVAMDVLEDDGDSAATLASRARNAMSLPDSEGWGECIKAWDAFDGVVAE